MSVSVPEKSCTLLLPYDGQLIKESDFQAQLESKDDQIKIATLKLLISAVQNGEHYPKLLMSVIKYCLHSENHLVKKLLLLYWEVVDKRDKKGQMLHEMILVCNAIKNNLTHPNEYIRGSTLRFLCKIKEADILESLIPSITANLEHRHSYVRKNAVFTVYSVYESFSELIPDAPELIEQFLYAETNPAAKRNAFLMLFHCQTDRALNYLSTVIQSVGTLGESMQLVILELIRKVVRSNPTSKGEYIRCIYNLVNSPAHAVAFEGANTLVALSNAPTAVRAAVQAYTTLLQNESDNNIKLIILGRLSALRKRNEKILQEMLMDILRILVSPSIDIRRTTLALALDLVNQRNVESVVQLLKKELVRAESPEHGSGSRGDGYRKLLVDAMHKCAVRFPHVVGTVVHLLMNYLGDESAAAALDVVYFVREIVEEYPQLRESILSKVIEAFDDIRSSDVYRVTLWIIGEYALQPSTLDLSLEKLKSSVGPLPLVQPPKTEAEANAQQEEQKKKEEEEQKSRVHHLDKNKSKASAPVVLADGTYSSSSAISSSSSSALSSSSSSDSSKLSSHTHLRSLLLNGDYFLAASLANTITKLVLRFSAAAGFGSPESNEQISQALLVLVSILRVGTIANAVKPIDPDSHQRLILCIRTLLEPELGNEVFTSQSREVFGVMLRNQRNLAPREAKSIELVKQADDLIVIRQLKGKGADEDLLDGDDAADLTRAVGSKGPQKDTASKLNRVYQLTGFSDPVYAEAHLVVQDYDVVLDMLVVNQTSSVLQNVQLELHTSGDLKVVERPATYTLPPNGLQRISATIKLTSTESGVIFGNIVYDNASGTQKTIVVLNNIHMDIMDYISPASCSDQAFRLMWAEFEWENKVAVNTDLTDLNDYLQHVLSITNMKCMTPDNTLSGECNFLAANLYARSMFGEDALLNLSVEKQKNGKVTGYIRIRSKTQGIALSLGDKITAKQRGTTK